MLLNELAALKLNKLEKARFISFAENIQETSKFRAKSGPDGN
jgi:hypothetical protein